MATINGKIQTDIVILDDTYDVSVAIPTSKPSLASAYTLTIYNEADIAKTPAAENVPMLAHVAASFDDSSTASFPDNFYLELAPPANILPKVMSADNASTTFAIKSLSIQFALGKYVAGSTGAVVIPGNVKGTKTA